MLFVVSGNIGSGKSSLVAALAQGIQPPPLVIQEPIEEWAYYLEKMYKSNSAADTTPTNDGMIANFMFQSLVLSHYIKTTAVIKETLEKQSRRVIIVERSPLDALHVFLPKNVEHFGGADLSALNQMFTQLCEVDVWKNMARYIVLSAPAEVCSKRMLARGRAGENCVTVEYLRSIEHLQAVNLIPAISPGHWFILDNGENTFWNHVVETVRAHIESSMARDFYSVQQ